MAKGPGRRQDQGSRPETRLDPKASRKSQPKKDDGGNDHRENS